MQTGLDSYPFTGLPNTRDLGGIPTADGRHLRSGMLLRSSALDRASVADRALLQDAWKLQTVVDMRTDVEQTQEHYDRALFPGVSFYDCPVLTLGAVGVTHEELHGFRKTLTALGKLRNPDQMMIDIYVGVLTSKEGAAAYRHFFEILQQPREGALLWHCTLGKDRAGLATVLLLYALGVKPDVILKDYLATNEYMARYGKSENQRTRMAYHLPRFAEGAVSRINSVRPQYLQEGLAAVRKAYGSIDAYLENALGLTPEIRESLKDRFLE